MFPSEYKHPTHSQSGEDTDTHPPATGTMHTGCDPQSCSSHQSWASHSPHSPWSPSEVCFQDTHHSWPSRLGFKDSHSLQLLMLSPQLVLSPCSTHTEDRQRDYTERELRNNLVRYKKTGQTAAVRHRAQPDKHTD